MNIEEFSTIAMAIKSAYPNANILPDKESKNVWYTMLMDLDYKVCLIAVKEHISINKFAPSIAEILEKCSNLTHKSINEWDAEWNKVIRAISNYGSYRVDEAMNSFDDLTKRAVRGIGGFLYLCQTDIDNLGNDRANFRDIYKREVEKEKRNRQLPRGLQEQKNKMIDELVENVVIQLEDNYENRTN